MNNNSRNSSVIPGKHFLGAKPFTSQKFSGAEPFVPHNFETRQIINTNRIPRILIKPEVFNDMVTIASLSGGNEIGWLGSVRIIDDIQFLIERIFMVEQTVNFSMTNISEEGLSKLVLQLIQDDYELVDSLLFWGHVHPANSTTPSQQDEMQMEFFNHNDFFIRGIFGRGGRAEFDFFDYKKGITWKDVPWRVYIPENIERREVWAAEIAQKVSPEFVSPVKFNSGILHNIIDDETLDDEDDHNSRGNQFIGRRATRRTRHRGQAFTINSNFGLSSDSDESDYPNE